MPFASVYPILWTQRPIHEILVKKYWELMDLKNFFFESAILEFKTKQKTILMHLSVYKNELHKYGHIQNIFTWSHNFAIQSMDFLGCSSMETFDFVVKFHCNDWQRQDMIFLEGNHILWYLLKVEYLIGSEKKYLLEQFKILYSA